jgi:hypothetical protein
MTGMVARVSALAALALALSVEAGATSYFVDGSVGGPGSGTIGDPYLKLQSALNRARTAGDTVYVRTGSYSVTTAAAGDSLRLYGSGSDAGGQIVLTAYPGETVTITNATPGTTRLLDTNAGSAGNHWTFNRLAFNANNLAVDVIRINTTHVIMDSCDVSNGRTEGVTIVGDTITIQNSTIEDFDRDDTGAQFDCHCIHVDSGVSSDITAVTIQRNTIQHCSGDGIQFTIGTGADTSTYSRGCKVLDNTFIGGSSDSTLIEGAIDVKSSHDLEIARNTISGYGNKAPIVFQKGPQRGYIHDNVIHDCQAGIDFHSEDGGWILRGFRVTDNLIYNLRGLTGFIMYGFKFDGVADSKIWNNTIAWSGPNNCRGIRVEGGGVTGWGLRHSVLENNLTYACPIASASNVSGTNQGMDSTVCNYNGWFTSAASKRTGQLIGNSAGVGLGTGTNNDQTGADDPGFIQEGTGPRIDFHLSSSALQCIDKGTDSLVTKQYIGVKPDLGYNEYIPTVFEPPSLGGGGGSGGGVTIFNGSAADTSEQQSSWFWVRGAVRVDLRVWSANTSDWTGADSVYSDSIATWKIALSDSICCIGTDYRGKYVASAADSMMFDMTLTASNPETSFVGFGCDPLPIKKPISAAKTGSGFISTVYPVKPAWIASKDIAVNQRGVFTKQYMRIRWQPFNRMTEGGRLSTEGIRTQGIRGLRILATIYYP